jgi:L-seryl-tRNA(Ser) seleniumtransferase
MSQVLRSLPSVNELLDRPPLKSLVRRLSHNMVVTQVGRFLDGMRSQVQSAATAMHVPAPAELAQRIADWIAAQQQPEIRPVINATGILLPADLGGAPWAAEAIQAAVAVASNYAAQDFDPSSNEPTQRSRSIERLVIGLVGAEAATVVNNHAGALVAALAGLAPGREVLIARGHLVEIPGSHRLPEIVAASGAVLREVGTTNCTRASDFAAALSERTAALLHVQTPVLASSQQPLLSELADLARRHNLPLIDDLGNGSLIDLSRYGVQSEPAVGDALLAGSDLVLFSGQRLLGGPPCGLIVGRRALIQTIERHPLMPALRADKVTLAALAATLRLYQDSELAERSVPLLSLLATPVENLKNRAERLAPQIAATGVGTVEIVTTRPHLATGDLPPNTIPSYALSVVPTTGSVLSLATALRGGRLPVVGRIQGDRLMLDLRTVLPRQDMELVIAWEELAAPKQLLKGRTEVAASL